MIVSISVRTFLVQAHSQAGCGQRGGVILGSNIEFGDFNVLALIFVIKNELLALWDRSMHAVKAVRSVASCLFFCA